MKKILAVIDAVNYTAQQLDAIAAVTSLHEHTLTVLMLEDTKSANQLLSAAGMEGLAGVYYQKLRESEHEKKELIEDNYSAIKKDCKEKQLTCTIKNIRGIAEDEVISESRFADLLIIGKALSFPYLYDTNPTGFVKNMLTHAQCPVMVLSEENHLIDGVAFCYNGTYSSMYAIKAFAALFPDLINRHCEIVYVCEKGEKTIPYKEHLQEYLKAYNAHLTYKILTGKPDSAIQAYLDTKTDLIGTFGAYGRSRVSRFFNSSSADNIIRNLKGPVFITHPSGHS
ncbi:universal stress protein [Chitinophaga sp.]|uniref:universal stress protein n=1 Tax=Chitinophaga sp. TaxID=1869181 RepID=UPI0031D9B1CF